jgi:hypothetical protein
MSGSRSDLLTRSNHVNELQSSMKINEEYVDDEATRGVVTSRAKILILVYHRLFALTLNKIPFGGKIILPFLSLPALWRQLATLSPLISVPFR